MAAYLMNVFATIVVTATMIVAFSAPSARAAGACLENRLVQDMISKHEIKTWPAIKAIAGISDQYKEVSAVRVCEQGGQPYYVVNVAGPSGESKQLVINAVDGSY